MIKPKYHLFSLKKNIYIVPRVVNRKFKDEDGNVIENKFGYFKNAMNSNIDKLIYEIDDLLEEEYDWLNDNFER